MYGDWETLGIFDGQKNFSESEKNAIQKRVLYGDP